MLIERDDAGRPAPVSALKAMWHPRRCVVRKGRL
jgi:hypothetical protein